MIPHAAELHPIVPEPLPSCQMPDPEDITEEGFGLFRDTWWIGRVPISEAEEIVDYEAEVLDALDRAAGDEEDYEAMAVSVERGESDELSEAQLRSFIDCGLLKLSPAPDDAVLFGSLEVGIAGLVHALLALRCATAASCRSHTCERSWSNCPVVFFAAPDRRVAILAELIRSAGCGLIEDRGMLKIYAPSVRETHALAQLILKQRSRFTSKPRPNRPQLSRGDQLGLLED